ncbi:hypothetical protein CXB51_033808 [Gossypium anomalum]|uniref:Aminotransferase-like plant mobile domain-containing protein n=1 Tax=Gossypium anomalum TaxID=47600 RepID=A0A8J5YPE9_9ROSI|nr:hypothetical protein CXB51_033808 [Gossypium anomalum]
MCRVTRPNKAKIGGCLSLLQSWARFRFQFLRPQVNHPYTFPLITRWNHSANYVGIPTSLEDIRLLLDQQSEAQFQWTPYEDPAIRAVLDNEHKVDLQLLKTDWQRHWLEYIEMWENRIHGKPYLLSEEERQRQIRVQRERRGPLNPRSRDDDAGQSVAPTQSPGLSTVPTQPPEPTFQPTTPILQPFQIMPSAYPSPFMYPNPFMFPFPSPMAGWNAWPD